MILNHTTKTDVHKLDKAAHVKLKQANDQGSKEGLIRQSGTSTKTKTFRTQFQLNSTQKFKQELSALNRHPEHA